MPIDSRDGGIGQDVERAACDIWLTHARADAKRLVVPALLVRPLVEFLAGCLQNLLGAVLIKLLEHDVLVAVPFVDKAILVVLDFSRDEEVFARPLRALLKCSIIVQDGVSNAT